MYICSINGQSELCVNISLQIRQYNCMRQTNTTKNSNQKPKKDQAKKESKQKGKPNKYKMDFIKKDNYDTMHLKFNITEIQQLHVKYVLNCIEGIFKNRFLYITTHKDGEIMGSGDAKHHGLTLQIEGAGLSQKHTQLKFDGFKNFDVMDFQSETGTWMNIPKEGVQIKDGEFYTIGPFVVRFNQAGKLNQIQEICMAYHIAYLSDVLQYNGIRTLAQLLSAQYNNFKQFPFTDKDKEKLIRVCTQVKKWYDQKKVYKRLNVHFINQPLAQFALQIGWDPFYFSNDPNLVFTAKKPIAQVVRGRLIPNQKVFSRIKPGKQFPLSLHNQLKIGNLMFELNRFNYGSGEDIGYRPTMEDGLIIEQDVGGSEWKLISLFAVLDGHGGDHCMRFIKENLVDRIRAWTKLLDDAGNMNQMLKILVNKTFFQLDYEFYKAYPDVAATCGCTALVTIIVESKVYVFSVGDCKGYLFRNDMLFQLNLDHLPTRGDQRNRIQAAGGFIQYDRLMGKCTLSRSMGQFQYKNIEDYQGQMKGKLKSFLSCLPDVVSFDLDPTKDDFLLMSTDGILQSMTIADITDMIQQKYSKLQAEESPNKIISSLIQNCKIISPDSDNMAAILIIIRKGLVGGSKAW